jgi:hypothetical protein
MRLFMIGILISLAAAPPALAESPEPAAQSDLSYADLADLALHSAVAARVRIKQAIPLKGEAAAAVPAGSQRFYVEAELLSLIRAPQAMPAELHYLADVPVTESGAPPRLRKKSEQIVLGAPVPGHPDEVRLTAPDAQLAWTAEREAMIRSILTAASAADAPPPITGIGQAFHVPGTLPGEGETQLFLRAANGHPVSLSVLRRPGQEPQWAVALGEIIDEAAAPPAPKSLLWYRLACGLPQSLPPQSLASSTPAEAEAIRADYALVLQELGPCTRTRTR